MAWTVRAGGVLLLAVAACLLAGRSLAEKKAAAKRADGDVEKKPMFYPDEKRKYWGFNDKRKYWAADKRKYWGFNGGDDGAAKRKYWGFNDKRKYWSDDFSGPSKRKYWGFN